MVAHPSHYKKKKKRTVGLLENEKRAQVEVKQPIL